MDPLLKAQVRFAAVECNADGNADGVVTATEISHAIDYLKWYEKNDGDVEKVCGAPRRSVRQLIRRLEKLRDSVVKAGGEIRYMDESFYGLTDASSQTMEDMVAFVARLQPLADQSFDAGELIRRRMILSDYFGNKDGKVTKEEYERYAAGPGTYFCSSDIKARADFIAQGTLVTGAVLEALTPPRGKKKRR